MSMVLKSLLIFLCVTSALARKSKVKRSSNDFTQFVGQLWRLDKNRINIGRQLNYQGRASNFNNGRDYAPQNLIRYSQVFNKPTYKAFIKLLDNYIHDIGKLDKPSTAEIKEAYHFLDEILKTPVMSQAFNFLKRNGKVFDKRRFKSTLYDLWFRPYWRSFSTRTLDSSGFEHVFVGEVDGVKNVVSGFHNWIQFYYEERQKHLDYMGYLKKGKNGNLVSLRFKWNNFIKPVGSMFIGTSPEFEIALYTTVYMMDYKDIQFPLNGIKVTVKCFGINRGKSIASCYPNFM